MINSNFINKIIKSKVIGSAQLGLGKKSVENQLLPYPSLEEQTIFAKILSDTDEEIQTLEHRLIKTRKVKLGMMQELLTGKTRLL
ncbi:restriction endonuclease subunit S [uncultured Methylophaga sp.]|uniref:restriction endonuclease subunit S n=1 Tax=uncultured Methylophaga sp. TaxID=285271 RepID=UPI00260F7076|nr:restriction endonuclease subunit S [uncultured Methylophaga sp.]